VTSASDIVLHSAIRRGVVRTREEFEQLAAVAEGQRVGIGTLVDALDREDALARQSPLGAFVSAHDVVGLARAFGPASPSVMSTAIVWARRRTERTRKARTS
jgi:hypothetical protein